MYYSNSDLYISNIVKKIISKIIFDDAFDNLQTI